LITKIHIKATALTGAEIEYFAKISDDQETLQELSVGMLDDFHDIDFHPRREKKEKTDSE